MIVFFETDVRREVYGEVRKEIIAVPVERVYRVATSGSAIVIVHDEGDYSYFGENGEGSYPDSKVTFLHYDSEKTARQKMKEFYWAAAKNTGAFMF